MWAPISSLLHYFQAATGLIRLCHCVGSREMSDLRYVSSPEVAEVVKAVGGMKSLVAPTASLVEELANEDSLTINCSQIQVAFLRGSRYNSLVEHFYYQAGTVGGYSEWAWLANRRD
uniref:Uncharacterized protein n=1 Tax=Bracon brevicornis TaxID=1563983 RepID=A0A6V7KU06_9HYME